MKQPSKKRHNRPRKNRGPDFSDKNLLLRAEMNSSDSPFIHYLRRKGYSSTTVLRYIRDTESFLVWTEQENIPPEAVRYADIIHYLQSRKGKVKQNTLSFTINGIRHYYDYLKASGIISENPASRIEIKGIKRQVLYDILARPELDELYSSFQIPEAKDNPNRNQNWFRASQLAAMRNKVIVGLLVYQGLGATELKRLTVKDVRLRRGTIYVAGTRKSNERILKLEAVQIMELMDYAERTRQEILEASNKESDLFLVSTGRSNSLNGTLQSLTEQLKKQNPKFTSLKQIRTSVITHWLKTHNLRETQYRAGHRFISSTEAYKIHDLDELQDDISRYHPLD